MRGGNELQCSNINIFYNKIDYCTTIVQYAACSLMVAQPSSPTILQNWVITHWSRYTGYSLHLEQSSYLTTLLCPPHIAHA